MQAARGASLTRDADPEDPATSGRQGGSLVSLVLVAALAVVALDVLTKLWVVERLRADTVRLLGGALLIRQSRNPGAAFGIAGSATIVFSLVAVVVAAVIIRVAPRLRSRGWAVALGLVLGGALGNLIDRVLRSPSPLRGAVVDFLDFRVWPSFNIADSGIVIGGAIAVFLSFRGIEPTDATTADADSSDT